MSPTGVKGAAGERAQGVEVVAVAVVVEVMVAAMVAMRMSVRG